MQKWRQYQEEWIGRIILKLESPADKCRYRPLTPAIKYAIPPSWLLWHQVLKPCHRRLGMVSHRMGMAVREDHQVAFAERHWLIYPLHCQPARSPGDNMEAGTRSLRHSEPPGCVHCSTAIQGTVHA